ncbi:MAG: ribosome-associated translation inhibitor RaiA [Betaproteobacteria bacterium]|nr:ribosome-associated translation inhibitor RaiA [Pseudomonadota bacterium]NBO12910.1 ribosome-associated translation inhibitor RaiA [Betaproteobacteria bacterium]NBO43831.1 ribosome-associated translation inhibitor RaiA [Betaproteobacteria bacterium]NBP10197.1 ribosome-associated translation inhibitor RaiA [Betaproteobacteria bacterium]NBP62535.1 ribosome-associated translation inhibitor RaiA [Betaproteobacteria bacterium]
MNLSIHGHHVEVTPALRSYLTTKLERIHRHFDQVVDADVFMSVDKLEQKIEVNLHVKGKELFAECKNADLYAAIDLVVDKLDRQVLKYKEQRHAHQAVGLGRQSAMQ